MMAAGAWDTQSSLIDLSKAHLPTEVISLPEVIRMTITEFGVEPLRSDWAAVLAEAARTIT